MTIPSYHIGSAVAQTLSRLGEYRAAQNPLRPVDLINIAGHCASEAHEILLTDSAAARDLLINGASRMLAAAEQLEPAAGQGLAATPHRGAMVA
ncbi:hypothetical protein [Sphingobium sp.]|uniref:hypothetical protein n=1 Tax=Sphingobium sp. TaxID=1912891 RepID=UPI003BB7088A